MVKFSALPKEKRRLTFYSEGLNYWPHLEPLITELLKTSDIFITYISSNKNDPGLLVQHKNFLSFEIDDGPIRNWFFENIDTDVMVMTMPDINQYQVKRSKKDVHYVYIQHSLVSLHMVYRTGAFDFYDTIFCAGPHHIKEMRALEKSRNLKKHTLVEHGYARLDSIIKEVDSRKEKHKVDKENLHILIAPSWGDNGTIESGVGKKLVGLLLEKKYRVTLRPHPQTLIFYKERVLSIVNKHKDNALFDFEGNVAGQDSLHDSDLMISDWSGAALDYALGMKKPVLFVDVPRKINNPDYPKIDIEPLEVSIRSKLGGIIDPNNIKINDEYNIDYDELEGLVFNLGRSDKVGSRELIKICEQATKTKKVYKE